SAAAASLLNASTKIFVSSAYLRRLNGGRSKNRSSMFREPAERVDEPHLVNSTASRFEQTEAADDNRKTFRARDGDVQSIRIEQELQPARHIVAARGSHREEQDSRLATLKLVDGPDVDALRQRLAQAADLHGIWR